MLPSDTRADKTNLRFGPRGPHGPITWPVAALTLGTGLTIATMAACTTCQTESPAAVETPKLDEGELIRLARTATADAARLRQLAELQPVGIKVASKEAILTYVSERLDETDSHRLLTLTATAFQLLGTLPADYDMIKEIKQLLMDQVAGYYDWEKKTLFVADWLPAFLQRPTLIHEVVHALQDQHFDLGRFMEPHEGISDMQSAIQALIEGDATMVMVDDMLGIDPTSNEALATRKQMIDQLSTQMRSALTLVDAPPVIAESLLFPYAAGLRFVAYVQENGGSQVLDRLYKEPPLSTEAILHPERWFADPRDYPQSVEIVIPDLFNINKCVSKINETAGEFLIGTIFEQGIPHENAKQAAAGWDGDTWALFECGKNQHHVLVWVSVWDTDQDATEAAAAFRNTPKPPQHVAQAGQLVVGLWGTAPGDPHAAAAQLLSTTKLKTIQAIPHHQAKKRHQNE